MARGAVQNQDPADFQSSATLMEACRNTRSIGVYVEGEMNRIERIWRQTKESISGKEVVDLNQLDVVEDENQGSNKRKRLSQGHNEEVQEKFVDSSGV